MNAPKRTVEKWKRLKSKNDIETLAIQSGVSVDTISRAINGKNCTEETFKAVQAFYAEREKLLKNA